MCFRIYRCNKKYKVTTESKFLNFIFYKLSYCIRYFYLVGIDRIHKKGNLIGFHFENRYVELKQSYT